MSKEPKRIGRRLASVLVAFAMLSAAFVMLVPFAGATPIPGGSAVRPAGGSGLVTPASTCGQVPVPLGSASTYAALSGTTVTSTGATALTGDLGVSPGSSVTGFPPGTYTGTKNAGNPAAASAEANVTLAFNNASARSNCAVAVAGNLGGQTLTPGLYKSTSSLAISSGDLTLSGGGNPNGIFVFQIASALTTTSGRAVVLTNGAQAGNVYWEAGSSITLGTTSTMQGTLLAYASITMLTGSHLNGRALARTGDVTLSASTIVVPTTTSSSTYAVTFTEGGLTSGTAWSVTLNGVPGTSTATSIAFTVANGAYPFVVGSVSNYVAAPSSGTLTVNGAPAAETIAFTPGTASTFAVTFTESGLVSGTSWSVTLNGVQKSGGGATLQFTEPTGTYAYTVGPSFGFSATPSAGSVTVNAAAVSTAIAFASTSGVQTSSVTFTEAGLAAGTNWSVTLNGIVVSSTTTTIVFTESNGTTAYSVGTSAGYTVSPSSGTMTVTGATASQALLFTATPGGGGGSSGGGLSAWSWLLIALAVIGILAAIGLGLLRLRRHRGTA